MGNAIYRKAQDDFIRVRNMQYFSEYRERCRAAFIKIGPGGVEEEYQWMWSNTIASVGANHPVFSLSYVVESNFNIYNLDGVTLRFSKTTTPEQDAGSRQHWTALDLVSPSDKLTVDFPHQFLVSFVGAYILYSANPSSTLYVKTASGYPNYVYSSYYSDRTIWQQELVEVPLPEWGRVNL
jgi:hypothetical protein